MGILRNRQIHDGPIRIEDFDEDGFVADDYANYLFDSDFSDSGHVDDDSEVKQQVVIAVQNHRRKKPKRFRSHGVIEIVDGLPVKRNMGAQKWRRVENAKVLANFADPQDICFDGSDLIPETISAFSRLLRDEAKMKVWNEFIEKDENAQNKILRQIDYELKMEANRVAASSSAKYVKNTDEDVLRKHHPAFSSESCFQRLDKKFRACLIKRRNIHFDYIHEAESALRNFFANSPTGTYVEDIASRIKRFYMHAVAQFLYLKSETLNEENSTRIVQVRNEATTFNPPHEYLSTLLKKKRRKCKASKDDEWEEESY